MGEQLIGLLRCLSQRRRIRGQEVARKGLRVCQQGSSSRLARGAHSGRGLQPVVDPPRVMSASRKVYLVANHPAYGLHIAAAMGQNDVVRTLLDAGAKLEAADGDGDTPLAWATYCGRRDTMDVLLKAGADSSFAKSITTEQYEVLKGDCASLEFLKEAIAQ
eukprot:530255_1